MSDNFKKSDPSNDETPHTETVIIPNLPYNKIANRLQYDAKSFKRLNKNIAVEIEKRPNMQLTMVNMTLRQFKSLKAILLLFKKDVLRIVSEIIHEHSANNGKVSSL